MESFDFNNPGKFGIEIETGPQMFTNIAKTYGWKESLEPQIIQLNALVGGPDLFYPYYFNEKYHPGCVKETTCAVHHWAKTW